MIEIYGLNESFVRKAIQSFCKMLRIDMPQNLLIFVDDTIIPSGICYKNTDDDYMIVLKATTDAAQLMTALAHEMIHVKQYVQDNLEELFDASIPYNQRWWEHQAYELQDCLVQNFVIELEGNKQ